MRKIKRSKYIIGWFLLLCSCTHTPVIPSSPEVKFSTQVQPILVANCTMSGCHSSSTNGSGEDLMPLTTYSDLMNRGLIIAGNPTSSRLYEVINGQSGNSMPPSGQLINDDVLTIYLWIAQGAKNN